MNWITDVKPNNTGAYLVSMSRPLGNGKFAFIYVAHYDADNDKWYKYDPFSNNYKPTEEIIDQIAAWSEENGPYIVF